ncbi:MAG: PKD domain-containing protein [Nitrosopumilus sp.]|nr:PKD domain-containing protein [Nitrosopumilus sp.]MDH3735412.1 PKD domain-containing protein [Nitrosopumilus sp.]MDH3822226.1 PKD domain-containing protein [Nitrosopumilus sp.]MDH3832554.1 PKD domain-containing protein [Nitrosopumilus sp.]
MKIWYFLIPIIVLLLSVTIVFPTETVLAQSAQQVSSRLTLTISPSEVKAGEPVTFSGKYIDNGRGIAGRVVTIVDVFTRETLGQVTTDPNGNYSLTWNTDSSDNKGKHTIKASSPRLSGFLLYQTQKTLVISPPTLTLHATPTSITEGQTITFSGSFLYGHFALSGKIISIIDSSTPPQIIEHTITDPKGQYSIDWNTTANDIGHYTLVAVENHATYPDVRFIDNSNPVDIDILALPTLTLHATPTSVTEGQTINFSGNLLQDGKPLSGSFVSIHKSDGSEIGFATTDANGNYRGTWNTNSEDIGTHQIYVQFKSFLKGVPSGSSLPITVTVDPISIIPPQPPEIKLILEPISNAKQGSNVILQGYITNDGFQDEIVLIKEIDETLRSTSTILDDRSFSSTWNLPDEYIGEKSIYAQCECNGRDFTSNQVVFSVLKHDVPTPLHVEIIPDKTSGEPPLTVTFQSKVLGGAPPYQFLWKINDNSFPPSENLSYVFHTADNNSYEVNLTVTDSIQQEKTTSTYITVKKVIIPEPEIVVTGTMEEGSKITFTTSGSNLQGIDSYLWDFGDGNFGYNNKVTHSYNDNGQYEVRLSIRDSLSEISVDKTLDIKNKAPKITFNSESYEIEPNESLRFEGMFADPGKDDTFTIIWYIDNKQYADETDSPQSVIQNYKFEKPGNYTITLVIADDDGGKDTQEILVHVKEQFPWALLVIGGVAAASVGGVAAKTLIHKPEPPTEPKPIQSTVTVEYRSGLEK